MLISELYAVNTALECLRDGVVNGIWPKEINYDIITSTVADTDVENGTWPKEINYDNITSIVADMDAKNYYYQIIDEKKD